MTCGMVRSSIRAFFSAVLVVADLLHPLDVLPSSCSCTAMCVKAVVGEAPCQCFSPGGNQTRRLAGFPQWARPSAARVRIGRHDERLSERVCVPRRPRTEFERDSRARDACGRGRLKQRSTRTVPVK